MELALSVEGAPRFAVEVAVGVHMVRLVMSDGDLIYVSCGLRQIRGGSALRFTYLFRLLVHYSS